MIQLSSGLWGYTNSRLQSQQPNVFFLNHILGQIWAFAEQKNVCPPIRKFLNFCCVNKMRTKACLEQLFWRVLMKSDGQFIITEVILKLVLQELNFIWQEKQQHVWFLCELQLKITWISALEKLNHMKTYDWFSDMFASKSGVGMQVSGPKVSGPNL